VKLDLLSRRMFLQGASATALAIPWLDSLQPSKARAQTQSRVRFVFMGHIFGRDLDYWYPKDDPTQVSPDGVRYADLRSISGEMSHALGSAFDGVRGKLSILRGLDSLDFDNGHNFSQPLTASGTNPGTPSFGYSLDAVLEESPKFNQVVTQVSALRTSPGVQENTMSFSFTSKTSYGQIIPPYWSPKSVYDRFFNTELLEANQPTIERKRSISNRVYEDFKRITSSSRIGTNDKRRLDNYMSLLSSVEQRLGLSNANCKADAPADVGDNATAHSAMIELEVAALACGLTSVITHSISQVSTEAQADGTAHHNAAHGNEANRSATEQDVSQHATYDRWVLTRVAEMLSKLDAVDDGNGQTLLDNTFFLYANSESRGFHTFYDMPVLVAGGQGKLNLGYYIDFRPQPLRVVDEGQRLIAGRPYNNLLITLFKAMGLETSDYQKFERVGFGTYENYSQDLKDHYAPFLTPDQVNAALPFLYKGRA